jgi:uncharacterized membrane protein
MRIYDFSFKHLQVSPYMSNNKMVLILDYYLTLITIVIDVAVGLVIGISAILAFASFLKHLTMKKEGLTTYWVTIRARLARGLLLALDFAIGSDILKTILVPTFTELIILAVVVGIRIILSWSLSKEIEGRRDDMAKTKGLPDAR